MNRYKLLDIASTIIIVLVVFIVGLLLYMQFSPVDVIDNKTWKLTVEKSEYHVGETIPVHVVSDKLMSLGGTFVTSAECKNTTGTFVSYPISEYHVNRSKGHVETTIDTQISNKVPNLPATCRIAYVLEYSVYSFRSFSEYNFTNEFKLIPEEKPVVSTVNLVTQETPVQETSVTPNTTQPQPSEPTKQCAINVIGIQLLCG